MGDGRYDVNISSLVSRLEYVPQSRSCVWIVGLWKSIQVELCRDDGCVLATVIVLRDIWIIESTDPGCLFTFSFKDFYLARYLLIQTESRVPASIHMISLSCVHCIALYVYVYMCIHKY